MSSNAYNNFIFKFREFLNHSNSFSILDDRTVEKYSAKRSNFYKDVVESLYSSNPEIVKKVFNIVNNGKNYYKKVKKDIEYIKKNQKDVIINPEKKTALTPAPAKPAPAPAKPAPAKPAPAPAKPAPAKPAPAPAIPIRTTAPQLTSTTQELSSLKMQKILYFTTLNIFNENGSLIHCIDRTAMNFFDKDIGYRVYDVKINPSEYKNKLTTISQNPAFVKFKNHFNNLTVLYDDDTDYNTAKQEIDIIYTIKDGDIEIIKELLKFLELNKDGEKKCVQKNDKLMELLGFKKGKPIPEFYNLAINLKIDFLKIILLTSNKNNYKGLNKITDPVKFTTEGIPKTYHRINDINEYNEFLNTNEKIKDLYDKLKSYIFKNERQITLKKNLIYESTLQKLDENRLRKDNITKINNFVEDFKEEDIYKLCCYVKKK
jgi:hypothetical protein